MGLPHVVVRFYTNPDGRAARRTTLAVLGLLGIFYVLPPVYGALGRIYAPDLVASGSDVLVLELPSLMVGGVLGAFLTGLVTAGAFAAFLSTSSGLTIAVAGVLSQDVTGRHWGSRRLGGVAAFRVAAVMLGIWWRGLTPTGAVAGLLVGGLGSGAAVAWTLGTSSGAGWTAALLGQPAAWSVPASFLTMVVVSRLTAATVPAHAGRFMVRLHTPEAVDLQR
jgi:cation/acetate symporter